MTTPQNSPVGFTYNVARNGKVAFVDDQDTEPHQLVADSRNV